jgi:hypothetical protein
MKTQTKYEEIILHEIRSMPAPLLPQALKILQSLKEGVISVTRQQAGGDISSTGFCGAWQDNRSAEEIIADIVAHRSGFGGRSVAL